jgi:hypothetical protein
MLVSALLFLGVSAEPIDDVLVSRPFPSWNRFILTEIYLCHACSCQELLRTESAGQDGVGPAAAEAPRKETVSFLGAPTAAIMPSRLNTEVCPPPSHPADCVPGCLKVLKSAPPPPVAPSLLCIAWSAYQLICSASLRPAG